MKRFDKTPILAHLSKYKADILGVQTNGKWQGNQKEYSHILPKNQVAKNLIDKGYQNFIFEWIINSGGKLHGGFHHLNSSQALAFNLFVPLIIENCLQTTVLAGLDIVDEIEQCAFEHVQDADEGTNFDFYMRGMKSQYYFEVKYTEDNFGSSKSDERHRQKFQSIYRPRLKTMREIQLEEFLQKYQLWRNFCYADHGVVVIVLPKCREDLICSIESTRDLVKCKENIKTLFIEDILTRIQKIKNGRLNVHYLEFANKYLKLDSI